MITILLCVPFLCELMLSFSKHKVPIDFDFNLITNTYQYFLLRLLIFPYHFRHI